MENFIIIHGCPSDAEKALNPETRTYDKHWQPWLIENLTKQGYKVDSPLMPEPWSPVYEEYKKVVDCLDIDENTTLIGHSCGSAFLVRYLGDTKKKVDKLILVAPWKIPDEDNQVKKDFYLYEIDKSIKDRVNKIIIFTSDTEEDEGKQSAKIFHDALDGELVELPNKGHYTFGDMGTNELPELLSKCVK